MKKMGKYFIAIALHADNSSIPENKDYGRV